MKSVISWLERKLFLKVSATKTKIVRPTNSSFLGFTFWKDSEKAADRVMKSVISWLERKLFLKVSATKTKIVRPTNSSFLGFTFWKDSKGWKCKPLNDRKERLISKIKLLLKRGKAVSKPLSKIFKEINQIIIGWINYFRIGNMKLFIAKFGEWLRHKVRVIIVKQWKKPKTIYKNLVILRKVTKASI